MQKLSPGIYSSGKDVYINSEEMCTVLGVPYTPAAVQMIREEAAAAFAAVFGAESVIVVEVEADKGKVN